VESSGSPFASLGSSSWPPSFVTVAPGSDTSVERGASKFEMFSIMSHWYKQSCV
jgi:hypothetical protein